MVLTANFDEFQQPAVKFFEFGAVLIVSEFECGEGGAFLEIVSRVNAHFVNKLCGNVGQFGIEMHVGHNGFCVTFCHKSVFDVTQGIGVFLIHRREPYKFGACIENLYCLADRRFHIVCWRVGH